MITACLSWTVCCRNIKRAKKIFLLLNHLFFYRLLPPLQDLGVLIFAKHPALRSIAFISIIGILCVVLMSQILIPFFFTLINKEQDQKKLFPWTLYQVFSNRFCIFIFYFWEYFAHSRLGLIFAKFNPFNKEKGKYIYHSILSKVCLVPDVYHVNVKKKIINPLKEDFSKPAVIICNHQSSLDIFR